MIFEGVGSVDRLVVGRDLAVDWLAGGWDLGGHGWNFLLLIGLISSSSLATCATTSAPLLFCSHPMFFTYTCNRIVIT